MSDNIMCYAARFPGKPGYGAVSMDLPEHRKETAKTIADWIKCGATIERVTLSAAREGMGEYLLHKKRAEGTQLTIGDAV